MPNKVLQLVWKQVRWDQVSQPNALPTSAQVWWNDISIKGSCRK
jgi:hypothetical protein